MMGVRTDRNLRYLFLTHGVMGVDDILSGQRKRKLRSKKRKLEATGLVEFTEERPFYNVSQTIDECLALEASGWKGGEFTDTKSNINNQKFVHDFCSNFAKERQLLIHKLKFNDSTIACQIGFCVDKTYYFYKVGYDPCYAETSPSIQLFQTSSESLAKQGINRIEFLGVDDQWKIDLSNGLTETISLWFYPFTIQGMLGYVKNLITRLRLRFQLIHERLINLYRTS